MRFFNGVGLIVFMAALSTLALGAVQPDNDERLQSYLAAAQQATARQDFSAAADSYRNAIQLSPRTAELRADLGLMYHEEGNFDEAIKSFTEAVRLNPSLFVPQLFLGIDYLKLNRAEAAIPFLRRAEKLNPADPQAPITLGRAYSIAGDNIASSDAYQRAVKLAPGNGNSWLALGKSYLQQVEFDARTMTSAYPDSPYVRLRAGEAFSDQGKLIQAASEFKLILTAPSLPPCTRASYGIVLLRQEKVSDAQAQFDLELHSDPSCALTRLGIAAMHLKQKNTEQSLQDLEGIWNADHAFLQARLPLLRGAISAEERARLVSLVKERGVSGSIPDGLSDLIQSELEDAAPIFRVESSRRDSDPGRHQAAIPQSSLESEKLYVTGQYEKCSDSLRPFLNRLSESSTSILASCAFYAGDYETASLAARRLTMKPSTRIVGLYWESRADQVLAIDALTRAGELDANSPGMHVLLGDVYRQERKWGDAEQEYEKALNLEQESRLARLGLAIALFDDGKPQLAMDADEILLKKNTDDPEANMLAAEILVQRNLYADAEAYLNRSKGIKPEFLPRLHVLLGQVYASTNRIPEAIAEFNLGLKSDEDGSIHYQLGRLYQKTGNSTAAAGAFRISKQLSKQWDDLASIAVQQSGTDISRQ